MVLKRNKLDELGSNTNKDNMRLRHNAKIGLLSLELLSILFLLWLPVMTEAGGGGSGIYSQQHDNYEKIVRRDGHKNYTNVAKLRNNNDIVVHTRGPINGFDSAPNSGKSENITTSVSSSVSVASALSSPNQKREIKLPLEKLFPSSSTTPRNSKPGFESLKVPTHEESQQEKLKTALLNHSPHSNENDKDLDKLVFSQLPEGSKLILRTVKIVRTDDDGNEEDVGDEVTSWDVVVTNATKDDDDEDFLSEEEEDNETKQDLISSASHPTSHYNSHGSNTQTKDKENKYYDEKDAGKHKKQTFTDTEGTKKTHYNGVEKGLTDFAKTDGKSQSNEGGRFKDSKKKNKGRKVTGFKRVYHKEEFQRTEHFYDDEDLKRIAEQFGSNDQKEKSAHGLKDDERKYHGVHKEHTDGQKVKNEKGTSDSFNKGHHQSQKNTERFNHGQNYGQHHGTGHQGGGGPVYGRSRPTNHVNHNYDGAYSTNKVTSSVRNLDPMTSSTDSTSSLPLTENPKAQSMTSAPPNSKSRHSDNAQRLRQQGKSTGSSKTKQPTMAMMAPGPQQVLLAKPSEMKVFFSPRERFYPYSENDVTMAYAPNFGPGQKPTTGRPINTGSYKFKTLHPHSKPLYGPKINFNNPVIRYAGNYPTHYHTNSKDSIPPLYSTIIKTVPQGNLISIVKSKEHPVIENLPSTTENIKNVLGKYRVRPQFGWIPIGRSKSPSPHVHINTKDPLIEIGTRNRPEQQSFTKSPFSPPLRIGKTVLPVVKYIRQPTTPLPLNTNNNKGHVIIRPSSTSGTVYVPQQSGSQSTPVSYNVRRNPQFSHFMNGLMDSVAGFFGRIG